MGEFGIWAEPLASETDCKMLSDQSFDHVGGLKPLENDSFRALTIDEIDVLEAEYGHALPVSIREFLAKWGACSCAEYVGFESLEPLPKGISSTGNGVFSHFFGASGQDAPIGLSTNFHVYRGRMPEFVVPIGSDGGGGLICVELSGECRGLIYYWDHNNEWDEDDCLDANEPVPDDLEYQNLHRIAADFEDFVKRLIVIE